MAADFFYHALEIIGAFERAKLAALAAETISLGGQLAAVGAGAIPILAWEGVFLALGAPYLQARQAVQDENAASGFSQGFVMGLLGWEWPQAVARFGRHGVLRVHQSDESLNVVRVNAYNGALRAGFFYGSVFPEAAQKALLSGIRKHAGATAGAWTRNEQISYVIQLAVVVRKNLKR